MKHRPEHHFVVVAWYDDTSGEYLFTVDDDTLMARYPHGQLWDGEEWRQPEEGDEEDTDVELTFKLGSILDQYQVTITTNKEKP